MNTFSQGINFGKVVSYEELLDVFVEENEEKLIPIPGEIRCSYNRFDMLPFTGEIMYIRESVAKKLIQVQEEVQSKKRGYFLKVLYGYRHPDVQKKYFVEMRRNLQSRYPDKKGIELDSIVHNYIAVPSVAGHPTGGAVDLTLTTEKGDVWMGAEADDYSDNEKMQTFSKSIDREAKENRLLLHDSMRKYEFAPFYGEWWHFSYGDREWAFFYGKKFALYSPKDFRIS